MLESCELLVEDREHGLESIEESLEWKSSVILSSIESTSDRASDSRTVIIELVVIGSGMFSGATSSLSGLFSTTVLLGLAAAIYVVISVIFCICSFKF